eukprot:scaffold3127_cov117-Amphora_coffeaeformis.AAC.1
MGKSTLHRLAEIVYDKKKIAPPNVATGIPDSERNTGYVIRFDFLAFDVALADRGWEAEMREIDSYLSLYIKESVEEFVHRRKELQPHFKASDAKAGAHLRKLVDAVKTYSEFNKTEEFLVVLVDEYDRPLRETLFRLLAETDGDTKSEVTAHCRNYTHAKYVGQASSLNKVLVTGVLPIVMDVISEFNPQNMTFEPEMLDSVGLADADVDYMLECVHEAEPFSNDVEKGVVRKGIQDHTNHLQFLTGSPLYHTRMVNEMMARLLKPLSRKAFLQHPSVLPGSVTREFAPRVVYDLLKKSD